MLIPRKVNEILEEMNDEVFKNMAVENANAIRRHIYHIIRFYQSTEADSDVYVVDVDEVLHKRELQSVFKDSKATEEAINDEKEEEIVEVSETKENTNEDVGSFVKSTKHDKFIKICSEIIEIRRKLGVVSISDLAKIVGKEFFSNNTTSLFAIPGDKYYVEVLEILNNISSIVNALSTEYISLEDWVKHVENHFDKLDEIAELLKDPKKCTEDEDKQLFLALEYLDSIKKSNPSKFIDSNKLIRAFVIGKIITDESDRIFLSGIAMMQTMQLMNLINSENFDIKDKTQVNACKHLFSSIKQAISSNKVSFGHHYIPYGFQINPFLQLQTGIDPKIYQKAVAFDKIVEALRPVFNELQGFNSQSNGWGSPFHMNPMFKA